MQLWQPCLLSLTVSQNPPCYRRDGGGENRGTKDRDPAARWKEKLTAGCAFDMNEWPHGQEDKWEHGQRMRHHSRRTEGRCGCGNHDNKAAPVKR